MRGGVVERVLVRGGGSRESTSGGIAPVSS